MVAILTWVGEECRRVVKCHQPLFLASTYLNLHRIQTSIIHWIILSPCEPCMRCRSRSTIGSYGKATFSRKRTSFLTQQRLGMMEQFILKNTSKGKWNETSQWGQCNIFFKHYKTSVNKSIKSNYLEQGRCLVQVQWPVSYIIYSCCISAAPQNSEHLYLKKEVGSEKGQGVLSFILLTPALSLVKYFQCSLHFGGLRQSSSLRPWWLPEENPHPCPCVMAGPALFCSHFVV